jgi:hypothetical protein
MLEKQTNIHLLKPCKGWGKTFFIKCCNTLIDQYTEFGYPRCTFKNRGSMFEGL